MKTTGTVLFFSHASFLDDSNGAAIASRALMQSMGRRGIVVEALCGTSLDIDREIDPAAWLAERGWAAEERGGGWTVGAAGVRADPPLHFRLTIDGVPVTIHRGPTTRPHEPGDEECAGFLRLLDATMDRFEPGVLIGYGGSQIAAKAFRNAKERGIATIFALHNFLYRNVGPFADVDRVLVASNFSARYHREALGLDCDVLPNLVDLDRVRAERVESGYVTFVNPSSEKGVYAFARIADELGRRRPDIPVLVVEGRGDERTLADCGLDLRARGTVSLMSHTNDPRAFWGVTRVCLLPSLWWENQPLVAVEALVNGVPVLGSNRGGIPEALGGAGVVLPLPDRLTPVTKLLPTAEEVAPWVEAVIQLWDDREWYEEHRRRALAEARRWDPDVLEPQYVRFFRGLTPGAKPPAAPPPGRSRAVVLVPHLNGIEPECEQGLLALERAGVRVVRRAGASQVDVVRNQMASDALHDGAEAILFVDADIGFDPLDALRLLARPEPVVSGVYAKKGRREVASRFAEGVGEVAFGHPLGLYPLKYAATGFLRIRADLLRRMVAELGLPLCDARWGRGHWPFFQPIVVPDPPAGHHYLGEDWAFSHRLGLIGVTPLADTSIRLWHYGRYAYGWEDAGADNPRYPSFLFRP